MLVMNFDQVDYIMNFLFPFQKKSQLCFAYHDSLHLRRA
jgi:hypothetical protein